MEGRNSIIHLISLWWTFLHVISGSVCTVLKVFFILPNHLQGIPKPQRQSGPRKCFKRESLWIVFITITLLSCLEIAIYPNWMPSLEHYINYVLEKESCQILLLTLNPIAQPSPFEV